MADRKNLREFQARLSERLRRAALEPGQPARLGVLAKMGEKLVKTVHHGIGPDG